MASYRNTFFLDGFAHGYRGHPLIQILLQGFNRLIDFLAKSDLVKLVEYCFMEAFTNAVFLWTSRFRLRVNDITHGQIQLIVVMLGFPTEFSATVCQDTQ